MGFLELTLATAELHASYTIAYHNNKDLGNTLPDKRSPTKGVFSTVTVNYMGSMH